MRIHVLYYEHAQLPGRSDRSVEHGVLLPDRTNIPLQRSIMNDKVFKKGGMNIHYLEKMLGEGE